MLGGRRGRQLGFPTANVHLKRRQAPVDGIFAAWDSPALKAVTALRQQGKELPVTNVDIGNAAAKSQGALLMAL